MIRTQIQLTDQQARRLRAEARDRGLSLAEVIRRYIDKGLSEQKPDRAALYDRAGNAMKLMLLVAVAMKLIAAAHHGRRLSPRKNSPLDCFFRRHHQTKIERFIIE